MLGECDKRVKEGGIEKRNHAFGIEQGFAIGLRERKASNPTGFLVVFLTRSRG